MKQTHRDLWLGHIYWVQHAVLSNSTSSPAERTVVKKEVDANTKQIARLLTPFYGEARSQKFLSLLDINISAVREYSEATVAGDRSRQDAALARLASNANDFGAFLSDINQYKKKDYGKLDETWLMMRQHIYVMADTMTTALAEQFLSKFSWLRSDVAATVDSEGRIAIPHYS